MLTHLNSEPKVPARVVILGGGGFIAGAILKRIAGDTTTLSLGRPGLDLLVPGAGARLAEALAPDDVLVVASAKAPCKDLSMLADNITMISAVCEALRARPVAHVIHIGSDAVYKDAATPLTEASCAQPDSFHGVMHLAREVALRQSYAGPMALVRPTLVYGADDPHNGYGPNRFRRLAAEGREIVLFGEGEERRDHVFVEDVAELVRHIVLHRSQGVANAVSGEVVSFRTLAEFAAAEFGGRSRVIGSPRSGPMPHGGYRPFDNGAVLKAFPGFRFRSWREGLAEVHRQVRGGAPS
jgi:UDP-glucose 4-epimerase